MGTYGRKFSPITSGMYGRRLSLRQTSAPPTTGLKLWLKADAGVTQSGGLVSAWADQSGNGNDVSQATSGLRPGFTASAINGLPAISFSNTANMYLGNAGVNVVATGSARSVIAVLKPKAVPTGALAMFGALATPVIAFLDLLDETPTIPNAVWSDYRTKTNLVSAPLLAANTPAIAEWHYHGPAGTLEVDADGVAATITNNPTATPTDSGTGFWIGADTGIYTPAGKRVLNADLCELLVYAPALSAGDVTAVRAYASARYGI